MTKTHNLYKKIRQSSAVLASSCDSSSSLDFSFFHCFLQVFYVLSSVFFSVLHAASGFTVLQLFFLLCIFRFPCPSHLAGDGGQRQWRLPGQCTYQSLYPLFKTPSLNLKFTVHVLIRLTPILGAMHSLINFSVTIFFFELELCNCHESQGIGISTMQNCKTQKKSANVEYPDHVKSTGSSRLS